MSKVWFGILLLTSGSAFANGAKKPEGLDDVCAAVESKVAEGDLVFVEINSDLFDSVAKTQNHWATHIGITFQRPEGEWYVVESTIPKSKITPLCDYVKKGIHTHVGVTRLKGGLSVGNVEALRKVAESKVGILYHTGFKFNSKRQFCSKLVYQSYDEALGVEVGDKQSFREMISQSEYPEVKMFWRKWFLGVIPWNRLTVSPGTQYLDDDFEVVFDWVVSQT